MQLKDQGLFHTNCDIDGDWVGAEVVNAVVRVILPRAGALARRRPGGADHEQVAAANVDVVLIVESVERGPNPRRIERAVALAWDGGATPVVVLTKLDLCEDRESAIERAKEGASFTDGGGHDVAGTPPH